MDEPTDADVHPGRVARVALALLGALLAATVLAWLAWRAWRPDALNSGLTMQVQGPMLESSPQADLAAFRRAQQAQAEQWGWVAGESGVARIPVREAMTLLVERDAAARDGRRSAVASSSPDVAAAPPQFVQQLGAGLPLRTPLRDATGRHVLLSDYFGGSAPVLLVFGYYRCRTLCNVVFDDVLQALALSGAKDYRLLGISIDPSEGPADAAVRLAGWRGALSNQPAPVLLTGDAAPLANLARAAGFRYRYDARQGQFQHPAGFLIVTPNGTIARYFLGLRYDPAALRAALALAGQGGTGPLAEQVSLVCAAVAQLAGAHSGTAMRIVQAAGAVTLALLAALVWKLARRGRAA